MNKDSLAALRIARSEAGAVAARVLVSAALVIDMEQLIEEDAGLVEDALGSAITALVVGADHRDDIAEILERFDGGDAPEVGEEQQMHSSAHAPQGDWD